MQTLQGNQRKPFGDLLDRILDKGLLISEADRMQMLMGPSEAPLQVSPEIEVTCCFAIRAVDEPWEDPAGSLNNP